MCTDTPVPRCAFGEHPKEAANGLLLWYSSNKFGVNFIPRDNYMICEPCERICIVAQYVLMEVWIQRQVLIRLRPVEMIEIHGNRKPQQVQLTQAWSRKRQNRESKPVMSQELQRPAFFRSTEKLGSLRSFLLCSNDPCPCSSWTKRYSRPLWNSKKLLGLHYSMITELVMMFHDVSLSCFLPVSTFLARQ